MKLISFKTDKMQKVGILKRDKIMEINSSMIEAINRPKTDELEILRTYNLQDVNISVPVLPSKIVCVGLNYIDHANELGMELPEEPIIFIKPPTTVIGNLDTIIYPKNSTQVDYEAELGIVISKEAHHVKSDNANEYIGGFTLVIKDENCRSAFESVLYLSEPCFPRNLYFTIISALS